MKQKLTAFLLCFILLGSLALSAQADEALSLIIDHAGLLTTGEETELAYSARALQSTYGMDIVILTVDSLDGKSAQAYADDYYDENGYAVDGLLLLLAMEEREWHISTCGKAISVFTDYGLDMLGDQIVPYLSGGDYYEGFTAYLERLNIYFEEYRQGQAIDFNNPAGSEKSVNFLISILIGLIAAGSTVGVMVYTMNTKRKQHSATDYLKKDSYHLRVHRDLFLYSNVKKVRRQQNTGSGGSSVHRSSSGRSHGGRGGGF